MIRLLADENVPRSLVRALRQAEPGIDLVTVYEIQYAGRSDPEILEWASGEG